MNWGFYNLTWGGIYHVNIFTLTVTQAVITVNTRSAVEVTLLDVWDWQGNITDHFLEADQSQLLQSPCGMTVEYPTSVESHSTKDNLLYYSTYIPYSPIVNSTITGAGTRSSNSTKTCFWLIPDLNHVFTQTSIFS